MDAARQQVTVRGPRRSSFRVSTWTVLFTVIVVLDGMWCGDAIGQVNPTLPGKSTMRPLDPQHPETYREVLIFGLKAKLPTELAFIDSVVVAVEEGRLPSRLVDQTYFWARTRSGNSLYGRPNRPIIYFIPALQARLKKLHINVELEGGLP